MTPVDAAPVGEVVGEDAAGLGERRALRLHEHGQEGVALVDVQRDQGEAPVEPAGDPTGERGGGLVAMEERRDDPSQVVIGHRDTGLPFRRG